MNMQRRNLILLCSVLCISFAGPLIKLGLAAGMPPVVIAFYRLLFSSVLLLFPALQKKEFALLSRVSARHMLLLAGAGFFLSLHFFCWITSLGIISTFASTVLVCTQPVFMTAGGYFFFGEKPEKKALSGLVLCILGIFLIAFSGPLGGGTLWGSLLALFGALFASCYFLCNKSLRQTLPLGIHTFTVYGICALFLCVYTVLFSRPFTGYPLWGYVYTVLLAVVCTLGGHSVLNWALKYFKASVVSVAMLGEPIGASVWAFLLFGEVPSLLVWLGGVVVLSGVLWYMLQEQKKQPQLPDV